MKFDTCFLVTSVKSGVSNWLSPKSEKSLVLCWRSRRRTQNGSSKETLCCVDWCASEFSQKTKWNSITFWVSKSRTFWSGDFKLKFSNSDWPNLFITRAFWSANGTSASESRLVRITIDLAQRVTYDLCYTGCIFRLTNFAWFLTSRDFAQNFNLRLAVVNTVIPGLGVVYQKNYVFWTYFKAYGRRIGRTRGGSHIRTGQNTFFHKWTGQNRTGDTFLVFYRC